MPKEFEQWAPVENGHGAFKLLSSVDAAILQKDLVFIGLAVLAVQFGVQPLLTKSCIEPGTLTSSLVLSGEVFKVFAALGTLYAQGCLKEAFRGWTARSCLIGAGIPSMTYVVQNYCIQISYQNLDPVVFNVLNQSKALFTAFFSFLIGGRRQSKVQCIALGMVTFAAICVSAPTSSGFSSDVAGDHWTLGVGCAVAGAALSGLGSGITEWSLQRQNRPPLVLSMEIGILGCVIVLINLLSGLTADGHIWRSQGMFANWTWFTCIPVVTQGAAGILVGWITKVAGGVRKVLATICGLVLTCSLQHLLPLIMGKSAAGASSNGGGPSPLAVGLAVPLVASGIYLHATFPPKSRA